jgi:diguanylate cyclase (GGDEF)-like protein
VTRIRFQTKVVALMIVVVVAAQLATVAVVQMATERSVAGQLGEDLQVGQRVWDRFYQRRGDQLLENAAVLADDFGFKAAVASGDPLTMGSALDNHSGRVGAQASLLLSPQGEWLAGLGAGSGGQAAVRPLLRQAQADGFAVSVVAMDRRLYRIALVPVMAPNLIGWVGIGTDFGDEFASDFHAVTGLDASFVGPGENGLQVFASSLEPAARAGLESISAEALAAGEARRLHVGQADYFALPRPLEMAGEDAVSVLLLGSVDAAMAPYRALKGRILWLSALAALLALLVAALLGRNVSRPIEQLVAAVRRVQSGDYSKAVEVRGGDEIADLAAAFGSMQGEIGAREQRILHQAHHDALTGLPNRTHARHRLEQALGDRGAEGAPFAVAILDLDRFKEINDTLGHVFADAVLAQLGARLQQGVRDGDFVARLGGDEFMLLLDGIGPDDASEHGNALLAHLRRPLDLPSTRITVDASIGMALYPQDGVNVDTLLRRADIALYDAKEEHRGVALYRPGRDEIHLRKLQLMGDLRQAIERKELSLRFQPKMDVVSTRVVHVEALLRWHHASLGAIGPDEFIPLAEHSGVIHEITRHVLDESLRCNADWRCRGVDLGLAVNLSAMDLMDADLPDYLQACLTTHGVAPGKLILELTESALMRDVEYAVRMLQRLRAIGVRLAIDDFGTGYSSLAQLKRMPVDELKIDKSFVMQLVAGSDDEVIVRSTIELGHNMGLSVIAEGVESDGAMALLRQYQCDMVQGYLFSPPLAEDELLDWCRRDLAQGPAAAPARSAGART